MISKLGKPLVRCGVQTGVNTTWQVEQARVPSHAPNPSRSMSLLMAMSSRLSPSLAWNSRTEICSTCSWFFHFGLYSPEQCASLLFLQFRRWLCKNCCYARLVTMIILSHLGWWRRYVSYMMKTMIREKVTMIKTYVESRGEISGVKRQGTYSWKRTSTRAPTRPQPRSHQPQSHSSRHCSRSCNGSRWRLPKVVQTAAKKEWI